MRLSCLHTHSDFCDGRDAVETMIRAAWERGFAAVGFSSHAPIGKKTGLATGWHMREERLEEYCETVRAARRRWEGRIAVFLGLEVDYIRGLIGPGDRDFQELGLDYIIGSVHYVIPPKGGEPFTVDSPEEEFEADLRRHFAGDGEALMETYWDALDDMIREGGFDILGHADVVKKNNPREAWFSMAGRWLKRMEAAAEAVGEAVRSGGGPAVEVNTGGLNRGKTADTYPSLPFLRLLKARGAPVIITADAHRKEELGGHYDDARETLLQAGYTHTLFFEGRQAGRPVWKEETLEEA
jgi:histidinol-phosphatase (PHP family)